MVTWVKASVSFSNQSLDRGTGSRGRSKGVGPMSKAKIRHWSRSSVEAGGGHACEAIRTTDALVDVGGKV